MHYKSGANGGLCLCVQTHHTPGTMANNKSMKEPSKQNRTFRLDSDTLRRVERLAEAENRTVNNMVETILKQTVQGRKDLAR